MSFWDDFIEKEFSRIISENKAMSAKLTLSTKREEIYKNALEEIENDNEPAPNWDIWDKCAWWVRKVEQLQKIARTALDEGKEVK